MGKRGRKKEIISHTKQSLLTERNVSLSCPVLSRRLNTANHCVDKRSGLQLERTCKVMNFVLHFGNNIMALFFPLLSRGK
jgi:hypothetical protein